MTNELRQDIVEWDVLNWAQALHTWQPFIDKLPMDARILAVGERNGGLSLWLALQGFHVTCTDRTGPTEQAMALHRKHNVSHLINYSALDIFNPCLQGAYFDVIIMKSVLGGLKADYTDAATRNAEGRGQALQNLYSLLKTGGYFLSADNMKGSLLLQYLRRRSGKQKGWHYFSAAELNQLLHPFFTHHIYSFGVLPALFSSRAINSIIHFANKHLLQWLPPSAKYIGITVAVK